MAWEQTVIYAKSGAIRPLPTTQVSHKQIARERDQGSIRKLKKKACNGLGSEMSVALEIKPVTFPECEEQTRRILYENRSRRVYARSHHKRCIGEKIIASNHFFVVSGGGGGGEGVGDAEKRGLSYAIKIHRKPSETAVG